MILSDFSVRHPVIIAILLVVLTVFGVLAFVNLNREMIPPVGLPAAHVITTWPGAGALDVESEITDTIENQLSSLADVSEMVSTSKNNYSIVMVEFYDGTDVYAKLPEIREMLNVVAADLPDNIEGAPEIIVSQANSLLPIYSFQVQSEVDPVELARFIDDEIAPTLARIPGTARINVRGEQQKEVRVRLDPFRARARDVSALGVYHVLEGANEDVPAGAVAYRGGELALTAEGSFASVRDIRRLVVAEHEGAYVHLEDVAEVTVARQDPVVAVRSGGSDTVVVDVLKRDEGNTIEIVTEVERSLDRLMTEHPGIFLYRVVSDQSEMTRRSLATVITSAVTGTALATLVILLFLHDLRATFIVALSIPLSILFAFVGMYAAGQSVNMLTLSGLTVAIGMIVDASIVTLENIWRHFTDTGDRSLSARRGAGEVGGAILASTLTTISVFIPLTFLAGVIGIILNDLSLTIVYSLSAAALVSVVVVPFLSSLLLRSAPTRGTTGRRSAIDRAFVALQKAYRDLLRRALDDKLFLIALAASILVASALLFTSLSVSFLPPTDTGELELHIETPRTHSLEQTQAIVDQIDRVVAEVVPEMSAGVYYVGASSSLAIAGSSNEAFGRIRLVDRRNRRRSVHEIIPIVRRAITDRVPGASVTVLNGGFDSMLGLATGGQGYQIEVYGNRLDDVVSVSEEVRNRLSRDPDVLLAETNATFDSEQLFAVFSQEHVATLGVSTLEAGTTTRLLVNGIPAGSVDIAGNRVPIRLTSSLSEEPFAPDTLGRISVPNFEGNHVSFAAFSRIETRPTVSTITKRNRAISSTIRGYLRDENQAGVSQRMERAISSMSLPPGVRWRRAGTTELIVDSMRSLAQMLAVAIFLVYVVMVIQFERFAQPIVIMASVPFCIIGVVLGLIVFDSALSIIAMLGIITLGGTVVNNAIVMLDYVNTLRQRDGMELRAALLEGASNRLKPILMTTMTTVFAVLPMALAAGNGSEVYAPLGQAIFGGMITSTAITLFIVPALYEAVERKAHR